MKLAAQFKQLAIPACVLISADATALPYDIVGHTFNSTTGVFYGSAGALAVNNQGSLAGSIIAGIYNRQVYFPGNGSTMGGAQAITGGFGFSGGINNNNVVVGSLGGEFAPDLRAYRWDPVGGVATEVGTLASHVNFTTATAVSDSGQIVGGSGADCRFVSSPLCVGQVYGHRAFSYTDAGGMQELAMLAASPSSATSFASGVNNSGQIVGFIDSQQPNGRQAVTWDSSGSISEITASWFSGSSSAQAINNLGQIVGVTGSRDINGLDSDGFIYQDMTYGWVRNTDGTVINIGDLAGGLTYSQAFDISDTGIAVGTSHAGAYGFSLQFPIGAAIVWDANHGLRALNDLVNNNPGFYLSMATSISDDGRFIVAETNGGGAVLLRRNEEADPPTVLAGVPTPETFGLVVLGLLGVGTLNRRAAGTQSY